MPQLLNYLFLNKTDKFLKAPSFSGLRMWALPTQHNKKAAYSGGEALHTTIRPSQILHVSFNAFNVLNRLVFF